MNTRLTLQYGLLCLQALDRHSPRPVSALAISREQGIPLSDCRELLERFELSEIVTTSDKDTYTLSRPIENLTSLEILQALAKPRHKKTAFRMLFESQSKVLKKTLEAMRFAREGDAA